MLNRLFVVIGVLAILAIAAAFLAPRFIQWGDYRGRMEAIAGEVLGAEVRIAGDIELSLLPQPHMRFSNMIVGPADSPTLSVALVEADFSLFEFLRDRYQVTRLVLQQPQLVLRIDEAGRIDTGIRLPGTVSTDISMQRAQVIDGAVTFGDVRSGDVFTASRISGELRLDALRGPFGFQGTGRYDGQQFAGRVSMSALDDLGGAQLSAFVQPDGQAFSVAAEGRLTTGLRPGFSGALTYRRHPPRGAAATDAGKGDFVVEGRLELGPDKALFPSLTITPDTNRAATRLTGLAEIALGASRRFNAIVEGAAVALPPRDATAEQALAPYELVRLLAELPATPTPSMPGTVRVDIGDVDLRALTLRRVRFDAKSDGRQWTVSGFSAALPGGAELGLDGRISTDAAGRPAFDGQLTLDTPRLDLLSTLWRAPAPGNPLFNRAGRLEARLVLVGERMLLSDGTLALGESKQQLDVQLGFGSQRSLGFNLRLGDLSADESAALLALFPDPARDAQFGLTFPRGSFALAADTASIFGLGGRGIDIAGSWDGGVFEFDRLSATDLGGVGFDAAVTAFGTLARPEVSGRGTVKISAADAPGLLRLYDALGTPGPMREFLARSLPADVALQLSPPGGDGGQKLTLAGTAGSAEIDLEADLMAGLARALESPLAGRVELRSGQVAALTGQIGLGPLPLLPEGSAMTVVAAARGTPNDDLQASLLIEGGGDMLGFAGSLLLGDPSRMRGNGRLEARLEDTAALAAAIGAEGIALPPVAGTASLSFDGQRMLSLAELTLDIGGQNVGGHLTLSRESQTATVTGELTLGRLDAGSLFAALAGPAALGASGSSPWPDGPLAAGDSPRRTSGRVRIAADSIVLGERVLMRSPDFDFDWDATTRRLRGLEGRVGDGRVSLDLAICCAGPFPEKRLTGRANISNVAVESLAPAAVAANIQGRLDAGLRFDGSGVSLPAALAGMAGDGNFALHDFVLRGVDPNVFSAVAGLADILDAEPEVLTREIETRLAAGPLVSPRLEGAVSIIGGVVRSPNVAVTTAIARLFGSGSLRLETLGLEGSYTLTPVGPVGEGGLITEATGGVTVAVGGTLLTPERRVQAAPMVDAIMMRALELEVDRLERLRADDLARRDAEAARQANESEAQRLAVEAEAARLADEQRRIAEVEAARLRAEEEARAAEAEAAARRAAEEEAARQAQIRRRAEQDAAIRRALDDARRAPDIGFGN